MRRLATILIALAGLYFVAPIVAGVLGGIVLLWLLLLNDGAFWGGILD